MPSTKPTYDDLILRVKSLEKELSKIRIPDNTFDRSSIRINDEWLKMINSIDDIVMVINTDYSIQFINRAGIDLGGKKIDELLNKKCYEAIHDRNNPFDFCPIKKAMVSGDVIATESSEYIRGKYFSLKCTPIKDEDGNISSYIEILRDITDQKEAEAELIKNKQQAEILNDYSGDAIFIANKKGTYIYVNNKASDILGYSKGEFAQMNILDLSFEKDKDEHQKIFNHLITEGYIHAPMALKHKDGTSFLGELNAVRLPNGFVHGTLRDLTKRNELIKEIKDKEERISSILRAAPIGIGLVTNRIIEEVNDTFCAMLDYSRNEIVGHRSTIIYPSEEEFQRVGREKYRQIELHGTGTVETRFKKKNGEIIDILLSSTPINQKDWNKGVTFSALDITESKKAHHKLVQNELLLKVRNRIASAFILSDINEVFNNVLDILLETSETKYGLFGFINKDGDLECPSMTRDIFDLCQVEEKSIIFEKKKWAGIWGESLLTRKTVFKIDNLILPDGHIKIHNSIFVPILYNNELIGLFGLAGKENGFIQNDASVLDELAAFVSPLLNSLFKEIIYRNELIEAKEKAEKSDKLKSAFLTNLNHEIRTPMNGIIGFSEMLNRPNIKPEKIKQYSNIISTNCRQLLHIVNDIIDVSMIQSGNIKLIKAPVNVDKMLRNVMKAFLKQSKTDINFKLNVNIDNDFEIQADESKIRQVLNHLLINAFKYTKNGLVEMGCELNKDKIIFSIKDSGIGIPDELKEEIFDYFRQVEIDDERKTGGNGLGLSIAKKMVELMEGNIWVESELEKGSNFYFSIPLS